MDKINGASRWLALVLLGILVGHFFTSPHLDAADVEAISRECNSDVIRPLLEDLQQKVAALEVEVRLLRGSLKNR